MNCCLVILVNFIWNQPFCRGPNDLVMCCPSGLWNAQFLIKIEFSVLTYGFVWLTILIHLIIMSLNWYQGLDRWVTVRKSSWFFEIFGIKFSFQVGFLWPYLLSEIIFEVFVRSFCSKFDREWFHLWISFIAFQMTQE